MAAAGVGGGHRSVTLPQLTTSLPVRFVATAVAGTALAAAGQEALVAAVPEASDGAQVLRMAVDELLGASPSTALAASATLGAPLAVQAAVPSMEPVVGDFVVADASSLVKAADLQRSAAEAAARAAAEARAVEEAALAQARVAEQVRAADTVRAASTGTAAAAATAAGGVQMVVGRITSGFGIRSGSAHQGIDIAAPIGTAIRAPLAGTVIDSGAASGFGQWVRLRHADGTVTVYGHINRSLVRVGQKVGAGQEIAQVGNRGVSTGPHLHFEVVTPGGQKINPRAWLDERGIRVV